MPASLNPPLKEDFLNTLNTTECCDLCFEPFDETHTPSRTTCGHTFGTTCLRKWVDSDNGQANACPKCRTVLFSKPARVANFVPGTRPSETNSSFWIEEIEDYYQAQVFVTAMWKCLENQVVEDVNEIYDADLEYVVVVVLQHMDLAFAGHFENGAHFKNEHWPALRDVVKEMVERRCALPPTAELSDHECRDWWIPRVGAALGWELAEEPSSAVLSKRSW